MAKPIGKRTYLSRVRSYPLVACRSMAPASSRNTSIARGFRNDVDELIEFSCRPWNVVADDAHAVIVPLPRDRAERSCHAAGGSCGS